jgi:hypothetical protein
MSDVRNDTTSAAGEIDVQKNSNFQQQFRKINVDDSSKDQVKNEVYAFSPETATDINKSRATNGSDNIKDHQDGHTNKGMDLDDITESGITRVDTDKFQDERIILPSSLVPRKKTKVADVTICQNGYFLIFLVGFFFSQFGHGVPAMWLPTRAVDIGSSTSAAAFLVSITSKYTVPFSRV